jgi:hypothetical protein
LEDAVQLLALRSQVTAELADNDVPAESARCVARLLLRRPGMVDRLRGMEPTATDTEAIQTAVQEDGIACAVDEASGIP